MRCVFFPMAIKSQCAGGASTRRSSFIVIQRVSKRVAVGRLRASADYHRGHLTYGASPAGSHVAASHATRRAPTLAVMPRRSLRLRAPLLAPSPPPLPVRRRVRRWGGGLARAMVPCRVPRARVPLVVDQWPNASGALPKVAPARAFRVGTHPQGAFSGWLSGKCVRAQASSDSVVVLYTLETLSERKREEGRVRRL